MVATNQVLAQTTTRRASRNTATFTYKRYLDSNALSTEKRYLDGNALSTEEFAILPPDAENDESGDEEE